MRGLLVVHTGFTSYPPIRNLSYVCTMTTDQVEKLRNILFKALAKVEEKHKAVIRSGIKYCVVLEADGKLVTADWLNDYPEVKKEIETVYENCKLFV